MFKLKFKTDNAAFGWETGGDQTEVIVCSLETGRILRKVADCIENGEYEGKVMDINGNSIGTYELTGTN